MITYECDRCQKPTTASGGMATLKVSYPGHGTEKDYHLCNRCSGDMVNFLAGVETIDPPAPSRVNVG
jgi:hypothetical protein